jgi:hypothetical protein
MFVVPEWVKIPLPGRYYVDNYTLVARSDEHFLKEYRYFIGCDGYVVRYVPIWRGYAYLHRDIMDCPPDTEVHHISGDKRDNRRCSLKIVTKDEHRRLHANEWGVNYGQ